MKNKKRITWTIKNAEAVIEACGGRIVDEKIYMPSQEEIRDLRSDSEKDNEFWSAYNFLRGDEDYSCDSDDPIAYFNIEDL